MVSIHQTQPTRFAVILAAGRGTRLRPLTDNRSKPMMPVAGQPMVERVLDMLAQGGIERFIVVADPHDQALIEHINQSPRADQVRLAYQERQLGMAHAVECAAPLVREANASSFLLASCDNLYPQEHIPALIDHYRQDNLDAALTLMWIPRERASATGLVVLNERDRVTKIIEKPTPDQIPRYDRTDEVLAAPSLYALSTRLLDYLAQVPISPRGEREFPDALRLLIEDGGAVGGCVVQWRMTLTRPQDLLAINRHVLRQDPACASVETNLPEKIDINPPVRIDSGVRLGAGCHIGPEAYLERGCNIGTGATVQRAVVLRGASVKAGGLVEDTVVS